MKEHLCATLVCGGDASLIASFIHCILDKQFLDDRGLVGYASLNYLSDSEAKKAYRCVLETRLRWWLDRIKSHAC